MADSRGEWVVVPTETMKPGDHRINATAKIADGPAVPSRDEVVLVVPEPSTDIAGTPTDETSESLALLVPREGEGASTVLQAPAAPAETETAAPDSTQAAETEGATSSTTETDPATAAKSGDGEALTLDVVDYDEQGRVVLSGKAESGATVKGVLGGEAIGTTEEVDAGQWTLSPDSPVAPGRYTLVLQQLDTGGNVVDQISVPFERAEVPEIPLDTNVVVQPGNSLWRIARRTYGDGVRFTVIYNANRQQITDPDLIFPGQILDLPEPLATN